MLIHGEPKNVSLYYIVDGTLNKELQSKGFYPLYLYKGFYYYQKTEELIKYLWEEEV